MDLKIKGVYKHFKGKFYIVEDTAINSEDETLYVVYRALYGENKLFIRKLDNFLEELDIKKYPNSNQKYRFELQEFE